MASGMMRCFRSIADAGTTSAVSRSAGASFGCRPMWSVSAAKRAAVMPATIHLRRLDGAVPSPVGKRWMTHSIGQPRAKPAPAKGRTNSMPGLSAATARAVGSAAHAGRDRDRRRGDRDDRGVADRRRGSRGGAARARRAGIGRDRTQPGPRPAAGSRGARPAVARERRALRELADDARVRVRPRADRDAPARDRREPVRRAGRGAARRRAAGRGRRAPRGTGARAGHGRRTSAGRGTADRSGRAGGRGRGRGRAPRGPRSAPMSR